MKCKNCGARIRISDLRCPYCSYMNEQAADRNYMGRLQELHTGMEMLSEQPKKTLKREAVTMILITMVGIVIAIAYGCLWDYFTRGSSALETEQMDKKAQKQIAWKDEYFPLLDSLYEEENYQGIWELYRDRYDLSEEYFYKWEHIELIYAMEQYAYVKELEQHISEGKTIDVYDVAHALESGLKLLYEYGEDIHNSGLKMAKKDAETVVAMGEDAERIFESCLGIRREETKDLYLSFCDNNYFSYTSCREYAEKLHEELFAGRKEAE
ncbi:MAG: hypothetical protein J6B06_03125 [Lachnospiraceae bacterium]|nr:hypothetical protein [Lachnospiraceae bacterium]